MYLLAFRQTAERSRRLLAAPETEVSRLRGDGLATSTMTHRLARREEKMKQNKKKTKKQQQRSVRFLLFILQLAQRRPEHKGVGTTEVEACDRGSAASDHGGRIYVCVSSHPLLRFCDSLVTDTV